MWSGAVPITTLTVPPSLPPPPLVALPPLVEALLLLSLPPPQAARPRTSAVAPAASNPRAARRSNLAMPFLLLRGNRPGWVGPNLRRTLLQLHCLDGKELFDPEPSVLAAVAGLLVSAERRERVVGAAVDLDLTGAQLASDRLGALGITRPHPAGKPVLGVVGDPDRVLLVLVGHDRQHRAEDLLLGDRHLRRDLAEDGRPHEVAALGALGRLLAAGHDLGALLDA